MPRPRSAAKKRTAAPRTSRTKKSTASTSTGTLTCPECGKTFSRAASLGAHRNRAHGVTGASARRTTSRRPATPRRTASTRQSTNSIDRDALLQALFPNGIPAKESVIRDVNAWLDQAARLARQS